MLTPNSIHNQIDANTVVNYQTSNTFRVRYEDDYKLLGMCDDIEAMKQAIFKIINTERYKYLIYDWNYGIELNDLIGKPIPYVYAEIERRIKEALLADNRIKEITDFRFSNNGGDVLCLFTANTIYGEINNISREVTAYVRN
nr:MAG TPA: Baseplate wedge protein [Caudoviricetes sp.]